MKDFIDVTSSTSLSTPLSRNGTIAGGTKDVFWTEISYNFFYKSVKYSKKKGNIIKNCVRSGSNYVHRVAPYLPIPLSQKSYISHTIFEGKKPILCHTFHERCGNPKIKKWLWRSLITPCLKNDGGIYPELTGTWNYQEHSFFRLHLISYFNTNSFYSDMHITNYIHHSQCLHELSLADECSDICLLIFITTAFKSAFYSSKGTNFE